MRHLPNALTMLRLALALGFAWLPEGWRLGALILALSTEVLDGALARRFGWESRLGLVLDPIADRALFLAVALTLLAEGSLSLTALLLLGTRDLLQLPGAAWAVVRGRMNAVAQLRPRLAGKATTALQYLAAFGVVLGLAPPAPLLAAASLLGGFAAGQYFADYLRASGRAQSLRQ